MKNRTSDLMKKFANARVGAAQELNQPKMKHELYRWLKRWVAKLSHKKRGDVLDKLERGKPLKPEHFVGAPSALGRIGRMSVASPAPKSREKHRRRDERKALVKEVFDWPAVDETVPLDFWEHGTDKYDGYELLLARRGKEIFLGVFNWGDQTKEYHVPAFGEGGSQTLEARHSVVVPYTGKLSFGELCERITAAL